MIIAASSVLVTSIFWGIIMQRRLNNQEKENDFWNDNQNKIIEEMRERLQNNHKQ